ncbi:MAG TPA: V-type ATP synthase subunit I [Anaerohalosphaeraceae bacterium]|nr:V-type ATP synthase subunit I [Anaerohalosphaeraceae bacterium]
MAIASMQKVMIVAHRSQTAELLARLQEAGIMQILDAERAMVTKEWPELVVEVKRHRDLEETIERLGRAVDFLKPYAGKEQTSLFAPKVEIGAADYGRIVTQQESLAVLEKAEHLRSALEKLSAETQTLETLLAKLQPWKDLSIRLEELGSLTAAVVFTGLISQQHLEAAQTKLEPLAAVVQQVGQTGGMAACTVVCLNEAAADVQKILRSVEFEPVSFEGLSGTAADNIAGIQNRKKEIDSQRAELEKQAAQTAKDRLKLQILYDHTQNLYRRIHTQASAPATDHAIFMEGWVKKKDYPKLEALVGQFDGCDIAPIEPAEGEEIPIEIDNNRAVRPFEVITRLYGMPLPSSVDPTVFLAPFFAVFFGLCLADAGYGLIMMGLLAWILKKTRGDKGVFWMLLVCGFTTFLAGAITGSWFGDAVTALLPAQSAVGSALNWMRCKIMLFDPMTQPMTFFALSLGVGYLQIQFGLFIAFFANLLKKDIAAAVFDQLTWIVMLNCLVVLGLSKGELLPAGLAKPVGLAALLPAVLILLFSGRGMGWGGRVGFGVFQLFSTVFYMGDILSYVRLMALGMVGSGFGLAINVLVKLVADVPYVGWLLGAVLFVGGHLFNLAMSMLGAFVHSLRLQFVEFFPKFFVGGGQEFTPLRRQYRYIDLKE